MHRNSEKLERTASLSQFAQAWFGSPLRGTEAHKARGMGEWGNGGRRSRTGGACLAFLPRRKHGAAMVLAAASKRFDKPCRS
ncbi:hypothetical protein MPTK1_5g04730 [Marchantia polymorpha subsp. ruderalis]|nr:hypothetical protein MARPO_0027s0154 [Marchantia polymorpha]BBN10580.1 hypothetical protein Mp_5g04730 [Marchantia polymorpha subsp. ruderalis]|eukprot:PTQ43055.1 hypothetical protein MARPO_0027s0154 [Marchantia polymorpha]